MSKVFCINALIKITIQSKALFPIALHCATVPNAASDRQTLPPLYNRMNLMSSLPLNVGRQADSPCFRTSRQHTFRTAGYPACKIAGTQERRNDGKRDSLLSAYHACLTDGIPDGTNARRQSRLIRCRTAVRQGSRQSANPAGKPDGYPARKTARNQDCRTESLQH